MASRRRLLVAMLREAAAEPSEIAALGRLACADALASDHELDSEGLLQLFQAAINPAWVPETFGTSASVDAIDAEPGPEPPLPTATPPAARLNREDRRWFLATRVVEVRLPDPGAAVALSGLVGFGAGHFYAQRRRRGRTHLALQLTALSVTIAGGVLSAVGGEATVPGVIMAGAGGGFLVGARTADVVSAPRSAHDSAADRLSAQLD